MSSSPYKQLFDLIPDLVDEETGIISKVFSLPRQINMPDFMYYKALVSNTGLYDGQDNFSVAGGTSLDRERALAKAIGESVERYSSGIYFWDELLFGSHETCVENTLSPDQFIPFGQMAFKESEFDLHPFTKNTKLHWCKAINFKTRDEVFLPAAYIYCPYNPNSEKGEIQIAESISTGLAAHMSLTEATLNGTLEVVERDSFMLFWLSGQARPQIDEASLKPIHMEMIRRFKSCGYQVRLFNITGDAGIPVIMATMEGTFDLKVPFLVSAACHMNPGQAVTKCLEELALIERYAKRVMINASDWYPYKSYEKIQYLIDHIRFWLDPEIIPKKHFIYNSEERIGLNSIENLADKDPEVELNTLINRIFASGYEVFVADITSSDIQSLGMKVIRSVIPGYLPLNKRYVCRPTESLRLKQYLKKAGVANKINKLPHPFA